MFDIGQNSIGDPDIVAEITQTLRAAGAAVGKDADAVVRMFYDDDSTVLIDYLSPGLTTLKDLRETAINLKSAKDVVCEYPKVTVRVLSAEIAFSMAYNHVEATMPDGSRMELDARITDVWQRIDGRWQAIHEHGSVPIDIGTGDAILTQPV